MILPPEVVELIDSLRREIEALRAENAELRRRLDLDSSNSSKPPSSDGLKKKPRLLKSLRTRTGKRSGGQKGHRGDTLRQVAEPDRIVEHAAEVCEHCRGLLLADSKIGAEKRQVFDLPEKPLIVTEHRAAIHRLPGLPPDARAPTFPRAWSRRPSMASASRRRPSISTRSNSCPKSAPRRSCRTCSGRRRPAGRAWPDGFAARPKRWRRSIAASAHASRRRRCAASTKPAFASPGATRWLHTASTPTHTFYRAGEPRSAVPEVQGGVVVHDHWRAYYGLEDVDHAYCNAHLLRELQAVCELDKEPWAEALRTTLLDANEAVRNGQGAGRLGAPARNDQGVRRAGIGPPSGKASPFTGACRPSIPR